mmetsp:Transcript_2892/g.3053  ORF Transcript_2892/g.3053 Transcript_2892/m.3053 type:complete len:274 (-) Transcript_2892:35-856(-)
MSNSMSEDGYTANEKVAIKAVREKLLSECFPVEKISIQELALVTMICKLKLDVSVQKYKAWVNALEAFGIETFDEVWSEVHSDGTGDWLSVAESFSACHACGLDFNGRNVSWIKLRATPNDQEKIRQAVKASIIFHRAVHSDFNSLRNGIVLVFDTRYKEVTRSGQDTKMRKVNQSIPSRPQAIYIVETNAWKRALINAIIYAASFFISEKMIRRMKFVDMSDLTNVLSQESLPIYAGGKAGGIPDTPKWIRSKLEAFHHHYATLSSIVEEVK